MSKGKTIGFKPDYAVPPGEILKEELGARGMSQAELAERTGLARKTLNEIIKGKAPITPDTALKLERVFSLPAQFWMNLEQRFQETTARLAERERLQADVAWLKRLPLKQMIQRGWITPYPDKVAQLNELLRFFGVASVAQWEVFWRGRTVAYRRSSAFESHPEAVSAWLRQGELEAQKIPCAPYDLRAFRTALEGIRDLSRKAPEIFVPELTRRCAAVGVAVAFVPELPKAPISGATRWLHKDKALIQLSLRYKTDDHLWFTFFHEAGHVLLHGKKEIFLESGDGLDGDKEAEANAFAERTLIPTAALANLAARRPLSKAAIQRFANEHGIAPGIVVGQLQYRRLLPYTHCNELKRKLRWVSEA